MTREAFEEKHGPIALDEKQNDFFKKFQHPQQIEGKWRKSRGVLNPELSVISGNFYNIGFFPKDIDPLDLEHDLEALDYAIEFTRNLAQTLEDGACYSGLSTEGDLFWFPLVAGVAKVDEDFRFADYFITPVPTEVLEAYDLGEISKNYATDLRTSNIDIQNNIFWADDRDEDMQYGLEESAYKAFNEVTELMKNNLTDIRCTYCYTDYLEFPVLFYGKDRYGNYLGIMTSVVWT